MDKCQEVLREESRTKTGTISKKKPRGGPSLSLPLLKKKSFVSIAPRLRLRELTALLPLWSSSDMRNRREEESEGKKKRSEAREQSAEGKMEE